VHGEGLGEGDAGGFGGIENTKERGFFGVVGLGRVAGGWSDAVIFFRDQIVAFKGLVRGVAPMLAAHLLVHMFGEGLGQTVRQGLKENGVIIIAGVFETLRAAIFVDAGRDAETANIVSVRGDVVGDVVVWFSVSTLADLLAQAVEGGQLFIAGLGGKDINIITVLNAGPEADHGPGLHPFFVDDFIEHGLRVAEEIPRAASP